MKGTWRLKLRLWFAMLVMFGLVYFILMLAGSLLGFGGSISFYFVMGIVVLFIQYLAGPKIVEKSMGVHYLSEGEAPEIHKIVEELASEAGIPKPMEEASAAAMCALQGESSACLTGRS